GGVPVWDHEFLINASQAEERQESLSRVALQRAYGSAVQDFARTVADDHARTLQQLADLMRRKGVSAPGALPEAQVEGVYQLDSLNGDAFDRKYIPLMSAEMQQMVTRFRQAGETADDREVRAYASATLPVFEREQQKAA